MQAIYIAKRTMHFKKNVFKPIRKRTQNAITPSFRGWLKLKTLLGRPSHVKSGCHVNIAGAGAFPERCDDRASCGKDQAGADDPARPQAFSQVRFSARALQSNQQILSAHGIFEHVHIAVGIILGEGQPMTDMRRESYSVENCLRLNHHNRHLVIYYYDEASYFSELRSQAGSSRNGDNHHFPAAAPRVESPPVEFRRCGHMFAMRTSQTMEAV
jgi:hypothetical protein